MRIRALSGRKTCERVKTAGKLWKGKHVHIRWLQGAPRNLAPDKPKDGIFVGTVASAKLDPSAVRRNRMRRRCREAIRLFVKCINEKPETRNLKLETAPSLQLLLLPRSSSLVCAFGELEADISSFFSSVLR